MRVRVGGPLVDSPDRRKYHKVLGHKGSHFLRAQVVRAMNSRRRSKCFPFTILALAAALVFAPWSFWAGGAARALAASARSPEDPDIKAAVARALEYLKVHVLHGGPGFNGFCAMTALKSGVPPEDPFVAKALDEIVHGSLDNPDPKINYVSAANLMALVAARQYVVRRDGGDKDLYRAEIQRLLDFLISKQNSSGDWDYQGTPAGHGDTSQTQFALLALWAASDSGFKVPQEVWERAAGWLLETQYPDGGFSYHPRGGHEDFGVEHGITVAGVTGLLVARRHLFSKAEIRASGAGSRPKGENAEASASNPLERVRTDRTETEATRATGDYGSGKDPEGKSKLTLGSVQAAIDRAAGWLASRYTIMKVPRFALCYVYGLERVAALMDVDTFAGNDWYADGASELLKTQASDGSWGGDGGPFANTCFAVLFLTRATWKVTGGTGSAGELGGGGMRGGHDLTKLVPGEQVDDEGRVKVEAPKGPLEDLINEMVNSQNNKVIEDLGKKVVEDVFSGKSEELIRQKDKLKTMVAHPNPEVRRTALWALGRCEDLGMVPLMIKAMQDENLDVVIEAQNALCMLSRRPRGFGLPLHPWDKLPEDASDDAKQQAVEEWRSAQIDKWKQWYFRVRPYDQRDDLTDVGKL